MDKCNLHTILRLPTGIFYAQGVKTNVLFFTREKTDKDSTKAVWFYDLRTNMPSFGKTNPLKASDFAGFEAAYGAEDRSKVADERWQCFTREEIALKGYSLDLGRQRAGLRGYAGPGGKRGGGGGKAGGGRGFAAERGAGAEELAKIRI